MLSDQSSAITCVFPKSISLKQIKYSMYVKAGVYMYLLAQRVHQDQFLQAVLALQETQADHDLQTKLGFGGKHVPPVHLKRSVLLIEL